MNRIKQLRENSDMTQEELAQKLNLSKGIISLYENDSRKPSLEVLVKLSKIFNCTVDYLIGKSDYKNEEDFYDKNPKTTQEFLEFATTQESEFINFKNLEQAVNMLINANKKDFEPILKAYLETYVPINLKSKIEKYIRYLYDYSINFNNPDKDVSSNVFPSPENNLYMCPVYGRIAAGTPNWAEQCMEGRLPLDPEMMNIHNPEECFFLRVSGESMNKLVKNGGYALIRKQDTVENGEIAVVLVNGYDATLKKFTKKNDVVVLEPMSDVQGDPNIQTQIYDKNTQIKILGKYIGKFEMN